MVGFVRMQIWGVVAEVKRTPAPQGLGAKVLLSGKRSPGVEELGPHHEDLFE